MGVTVARWVATANRCKFFAKRAVSNAISPMRDAVQEAAGYSGGFSFILRGLETPVQLDTAGRLC